MLRLADCSSDSEGELPNLDMLSTRSGQTSTKRTLAREASPAKSPSKMLVPKSASKPRRVRRLDGGAGLDGSILFQKCHDLPSSPKKSPAKSPAKKAGSLLQPSIFEDDESRSPPLTARKFRLREPKRAAARQQAAALDSDEGDDSSFNVDDYLGQSLIAGNQTLLSQASSSLDEPDSTVSLGSAVDDTVDMDQDLVDAQLAQELSTMGIVDQGKADDQVDETTSVFMDQDSSHEETITETASADSEDSGSDFESDSTEDATFTSATRPSSTKPRRSGVQTASKQRPGTASVLSPKPANVLLVSKQEVADEKMAQPPAAPKVAFDLADELAKMNLAMSEWSDEENRAPAKDAPSTPPETPSKPSRPKGLVSPTKHARIPKTPHRPSSDAFWNADVVNSWNDKHSPRKPALPFRPLSTTVVASPNKKEKRSFDEGKQALATAFLEELDRKITDGKIAELAATTGGVELVWSKTLNTTAGRAKWRRETIKTKQADGTVASVVHKHHAAIELAEKVITDEDKLLNTLAHEFCHLANFMVNGVTNNPHGKEFKAWAARCSRAFADRGIQVTTKHSYEIDFKYIWDCSNCGTTYRRHSRSINPAKHRCGSCKSELRQVKPVPRAAGKPSEYQTFLKANMKLVKEKNPGVAPKEIMRMVADMWAARSKNQTVSEEEECTLAEEGPATVGEETEVVDLTL